MAAGIKRAIIKSVSEAITAGSTSQVAASWIASSSVLLDHTNDNTDAVKYKIPLPDVKHSDCNEIIENIQSKKDQIRDAAASKQINFKEISPDRRSLKFEVNVKDVIRDLLNGKPTELTHEREKKKIVIEFSSPNIAKEFHFGHLRSTIIGNALSNIMEKMGNEVVRLNYLGDWGPQIGLVAMGWEKLGYNDQTLKEDIMKKLQESYSYCHRLAQRDEEISKKAREIFHRMESEDKDTLEMWQKFRKWTEEDLSALYERIGIVFDDYDWESNYRKSMADTFMKTFEGQNILEKDELDRTVVEIDGKSIPILKSDGTTLYLLRDLIAAFNRRNRFDFDHHYYVVDGTQAEHFNNLKNLCKIIEPELAPKLEHIRFGVVKGMSSRKGNTVSLKDVLDEAQERMRQKQLMKKTTKGLVTDTISDILGTSAVIINDFRRRRISNYDFMWEDVLRTDGDTGIHLQYSHCRVCSILKKSPFKIAPECDPDALLEPAAIRLVLAMSQYEQALSETEGKMDPQVLTGYLFGLAKTVNYAANFLNVNRSEPLLAEQRLLLFNTGRLILAEALGLLGLRVVEQM